MSLESLLLQPATELLARLRAGEVSAVELTEATLARHGALNPDLNAVVTYAEGTRAVAEESDARRRRGEAGPLEGLPITIKDAFEVAGLRSTGGAPGLADHKPVADAAAVARLRAAGAIILGKTNVPPFSGDFIADNPLFGRTSNPWDLTRSPGGSSGGAAAAVATGMSAFELGSDLGGSIRWPAHACGLFGLKTTFGLVPTEGHIPPAPRGNPTFDLSVVGPLARSAADLSLILDVLAPAGEQRGAMQVRLPPPRLEQARGLRIALWDADAFAPVDPWVAAAISTAARRLADAGATINLARPQVTLPDCYEIYGLINGAQMAFGYPEKLRERMRARAAELAKDDLSHGALQARGAVLDMRDWLALTDRRARIKAAWAAFFRDWDALLLPPAPVGAVPHPTSADLAARSLDVGGSPRPWLDFLLWSSLATLAHLPAAVAPVEKGPDGLPRGVQIVCAEGHDRQAIAIAALLEQLGGRFAPPPMAQKI